MSCQFHFQACSTPQASHWFLLLLQLLQVWVSKRPNLVHQEPSFHFAGSEHFPNYHQQQLEIQVEGLSHLFGLMQCKIDQLK